MGNIDRGDGICGLLAPPPILSSTFQHRVKVSSSQYSGHCVDAGCKSLVWLTSFKMYRIATSYNYMLKWRGLKAV